MKLLLGMVIASSITGTGKVAFTVNGGDAVCTGYVQRILLESCVILIFLPEVNAQKRKLGRLHSCKEYASKR